MTTQNKSRPHSRWLWVGFFAGLWTVLALAEGAQSYIQQLHYDKPVSWELSMRRAFKSWYSCGFLSIGVLWLCQRLPFETGKVGRWLGMHIPAAMVFSISAVALHSWLLAGEVSVQDGSILTFSYLFRKLGIHYFFYNMIIYWMIVLAHFGWSSYQRFRQQQVHEAELQQQLVEARLDALRMQLNPHFLFNTLHTVSSLIHENPAAAERIIVRLSDLLRLSLDKSKGQEVPLSQELAFLDLYLEIEQTRFADRLKVERKIEPGLQDALVPYLILQPLVENAIRHGIEQREEQGHLAIAVHRDNGQLGLIVRDNGSGLADAAAPPREGIGLSNTRSRLRHLYGDNQRLELQSLSGGGLEVRITIPLRTRASAT